MVRPCLVIQVVLNELEAGDAYGVEAEVIGAASVSHGDGGDAEILQGRDPLRKDGRDRGIALSVNAANLAGPVVHVEIGGDQLLLGLYLERSRIPTHVLRQLHLVGRGGSLQ